MKFKIIEPPPLKELFIEQLAHMILSGTLAIGKKLPFGRQPADIYAAVFLLAPQRNQNPTL